MSDDDDTDWCAVADASYAEWKSDEARDSLKSEIRTAALLEVHAKIQELLCDGSPIESKLDILGSWIEREIEE